MPAGANKKQTQRHDGGTSRVCRFCGGVGARVIYGLDGGKIAYVHRRCVGPKPKENLDPRTPQYGVAF